MKRNKEAPLRDGRKNGEARVSPETDPFFDVQQTVSCTECTGLLPAQIQTEEQAESVSSLESIHPVKPGFIGGN